MKFILVFILLTFSNLLSANECMDLMRSFLTEEKVVAKNTEKMDITKYGLVDNTFGRKRFEHLYLQCMSPEKNDFKILAHQRFSRYQKMISIATTVVGFTQVNWEKPKDMQWFARLGYILTFGEILERIGGKLVKENGNRFAYIIKDYLFNRSAIASMINIGPLIFDLHQEDKKKVEELKKSPTFNEDIKKLKEYAFKDSLIERYQKELMAYLSHLEVINTGLGVHEGVDFDNLTPKDLEDKDIQKVVMAAIIAQEYEQNKGLLNVTDRSLSDFYLFDSLYSIAKIPKDLIVNKAVDKMMCLNHFNVNRGLTQAIGVSVLNQIVFADFYGVTYQVLKKKLINQ